MNTRIEFLYLSEPDMIRLGVTDAQACIATAEEVFRLLAKGDYLMGGSAHNSHGMPIVFPKESPFPNMPVAGPDRRFVAMPAYLGGEFDVCGIKWYGSNAANTARGLPRSILTVTLNDKDTGAPLCIMSANLLSAARTGAVPGAAVKHLARKDARILSVIGCGPINASCIRNIMTQVPNAEKIFCFDLFLEKAQALAEKLQSESGVACAATDSLEAALRESDIVSVAASRLKPLYIDSGWLKKGATVLLTGPATGDDDFWLKSRIVYDHIGLHENYVAEAIESGDKDAYYGTVIGGPIYRLIDQGKLPPLKESTSIGMIINGDRPGRTDDDEICIFVACGMAVFDVGWGYRLYQKALRENVGQKLLLWDTPAI